MEYLCGFPDWARIFPFPNRESRLRPPAAGIELAAAEDRNFFQKWIACQTFRLRSPLGDCLRQPSYNEGMNLRSVLSSTHALAAMDAASGASSHRRNTTAEVSLRPEGRAADALRELRLTPGFVRTAEGSVLIELGQTRVLCNATIENSVPGWLRNQGRGWVTAEYAMLPRATVTRTPRESERGRITGRTHEIQRLIGRSLRGAVDLKALGERTVILDCDVLQADGGTRTAAITGAAVALELALSALVRSGTLPVSPLRQMVAATSVGRVSGQPLLDLCYEEDAQAEVDMNVVMTEDGGLVETQATAEKGSYTRAELQQLLDLADKGLQEIFAAQRALLAAVR